MGVSNWDGPASKHQKDNTTGVLVQGPANPKIDWDASICFLFAHDADIQLYTI